MEDKPSFLLPRWFYCILVNILFYQISGYFFSTFEIKPLLEEKIAYIAHINEVSPGTFLLYMKGEDKLTIVFFIIMQILMYGYFVYVGILTIIKKNQKVSNKLKKYIRYSELSNKGSNISNAFRSKFQKNGDLANKQDDKENENDHQSTQSKIIQSCNQILNVFFTFFWWIFFTPFIEINSGVYVCGANSFLIAYRDSPDCSQKPQILKIFSLIGLSFTLVTATISVCLFRSYEFHEPNLLKRKFKLTILLQVPCHFLIIFCYYLNLSSTLIIKHVLASVIGILMFSDTLSDWPFLDIKILIFYGWCCVGYEVSVILCHLWIFTDYQIVDQFFYILILLSKMKYFLLNFINRSFLIAIPIGGFMTAGVHYAFEKVMRINSKNIHTMKNKIDFYLEEIVKLLLESKKDEKSGFKLSEVIIYHMDQCLDQECECHKESFKFLQRDQDKLKKYEESKLELQKRKEKSNFKEQSPKNSQINNQQEEIFRLVDSLFKWVLQLPMIQKDYDEYEHLTLKYISYLAKYRHNTARAFYELKAILSGRSKTSLYFRMISKILTHSIQQTMVQDEKMSNTSRKEEKEDLSVWIVFQIEKFKDKFVPAIIECLQQKCDFWIGMQKGFNKMDQCIQYCLKSAKNIQKLDESFQLDLNLLPEEVKNTAMIIKLKSIFQVIVKGFIYEAIKLEQNANDMRKKDNSLSANGLNNSTIFKRQTVSLIVSFAKQPGLILNKLPHSIQNLFNFTSSDVQNITKIEQLMPKIISNVHNGLMRNVNERGAHSPYVGVKMPSQKNIDTFCSDKSGYIFPAKIFIGHSFSCIDDFCFAGTILKQIDNFEYLIFDNSGKIQGITEHLFMKLFSNKVTKNRLSLRDLYKHGYIFIMFSEIMEFISKQFNDHSEDAQTVQFQDKKAQMSLNSNYLKAFKSFENYLQMRKFQINLFHFVFFLRQQNHIVPDLLTQSGREIIMKYIYSKSSTSQKSSQILDQKQKKHTNHCNHWRVLFNYQLHSKDVKYENGKKEFHIFSLQVFDIQEKKHASSTIEFKDNSTYRNFEMTHTSNNSNKSFSENFSLVKTKNSVDEIEKMNDEQSSEFKQTQFTTQGFEKMMKKGELKDFFLKNKQISGQIQQNGDGSTIAPKSETNKNNQNIKNNTTDLILTDSNAHFQFNDQGDRFTDFIERQSEKKGGETDKKAFLNTIEKEESNNHSLFDQQDHQVGSQSFIQHQNDNSQSHLNRIYTTQHYQTIQQELQLHSNQASLQTQQNMNLYINSQGNNNSVQQIQLASIETNHDGDISNKNRFHKQSQDVKDTTQNGLVYMIKSVKQKIVSTSQSANNLLSLQNLQKGVTNEDPPSEFNEQNKIEKNKTDQIKIKKSSMSKKKKEGDDMCSLGSYSSKLNKNGYQFIKEIINSKKLPFIAQAYYSVLNLFILLLIIEIIFSALYKTQQFEIAMGKFNNFKSSSDMESNYKRSLSASIRYKASETYANINSTQSEIEKVIALQDIQNSLEFEQEKDIVLNMIQSNSEEISYIYFDNYMNQNTINNENTEFLIEISYQQIKQLANSSPAESIFSSSLLNLMYNMDTFVQTVDNLLLHNKNDILSNLNDIERMSYITSIIFSIFCILITIAAFPLAKKLSKHEQKIVLLVSRISIDEISKELHKFQVCLDSMNSKDESFLSSNFYSILEFSSSSQEDNEKDIITNKKKSLHKSNSFHKQIPKKNANGVNSRILDHRVGMMKFFISIGLTSIFSALFFCLTMSYTLITNPSIKSSFELTMQSLKARSNFGSFNVNGEILAELNYFNEVYQNFPDQTSVFRQQVLNETKYDVVELQNFSSDVLASMIYYSSEILSVDSGYASILKLLFSKNLCTAFKSCQNSGFSVCQTLPPNCNDFEQGISGIISTSFQLYGSYELIFSSNAPSTTTSLEFIHSSEFMTMIAQGFLAPDLAFAAFSQICLSAVEGIGNSISFALTIIYALVGPLLLIGTIIFLMIHWRHLKHNLISLNFLLLFIPQQKLQEDITIHILKAIRSS